MRYTCLFLILFSFACSKKNYGPPPVQIPANAVFQGDLHKAPNMVLGTWRYTVKDSKCGGGFMVNVVDPQGVSCQDFIAAEHKQFIENQVSKAPGLKDTMRFLKAEKCDLDGMPCLYLELATRNIRQVQEDESFTQGATYLMCKGKRAVSVTCLVARNGDLTDEARAEIKALAETFN